MREAKPFPVDLQDSGFDRLAQSGLRGAPGGRLDEAHRRVCERGYHPRDQEPWSPEPADAS